MCFLLSAREGAGGELNREGEELGGDLTPSLLQPWRSSLWETGPACFHSLNPPPALLKRISMLGVGRWGVGGEV